MLRQVRNAEEAGARIALELSIREVTLMGSVLVRAHRSTTVFFCLAALFVLFKHRANVRRLLDGSESRMRSKGV